MVHMDELQALNSALGAQQRPPVPIAAGTRCPQMALLGFCPGRPVGTEGRQPRFPPAGLGLREGAWGRRCRDLARSHGAVGSRHTAGYGATLFCGSSPVLQPCHVPAARGGAVVEKLDTAPAGGSAGQHTLPLRRRRSGCTSLPADLVSMVLPLLLPPQRGPRPFWGACTFWTGTCRGESSVGS